MSVRSGPYFAPFPLNRVTAIAASLFIDKFAIFNGAIGQSGQRLCQSSGVAIF